MPDSDISGPLLAHNDLLLGGRVAAPDGVEAVLARFEFAEFAATFDGDRFQFALDTSEWVRGEHRFSLRARGCDGSVEALDGVADVQPFGPPPPDEAAVLATVDGGGAAMWCEAPPLDRSRPVDGPVEVRGWAVSPAGIERVIVTVGRRRRLEALYGLPRTDLRAGFGDELAADCGFVLALDPEELPPGEHLLEVVAVAADGTAIGMAGLVEVVGRSQPEAVARGEAIEPLPASYLPAARLGAGGPADTFEPRLDASHERFGHYSLLAALGERGRVLDVGCQEGWGTALLAGGAGEAVGVDPAPLAIGDAQRRWADRARFLVADPARLPFEDRSFELVLCTAALTRVADPEAVLAELWRVLAEDGTLAIGIAAGSRRASAGARPLDEARVRDWLGERFAHVADWSPRLELATSGGERAEGPVVRVAAPSPPPGGGERGSLLIAAARPLPPPPGPVLVDAAAIDDLRAHRTELWRERSVLAEVRMATLRTEGHYLSSAHRRTLQQAREREREAERELAATRNELARAAAASEAMRGSRSWRLTRPLRAVGELLRRRRG